MVPCRHNPIHHDTRGQAPLETNPVVLGRFVLAGINLQQPSPKFGCAVSELENSFKEEGFIIQYHPSINDDWRTRQIVIKLDSNYKKGVCGAKNVYLIILPICKAVFMLNFLRSTDPQNYNHN